MAPKMPFMRRMTGWIAEESAQRARERAIGDEVAKRLGERFDDIRAHGESLVRQPEDGWRPVTVADCFKVDLATVLDPLGQVKSKRSVTPKFIVLLRDPLNTNESKLPVVIADSWKRNNPFHMWALDSDQHVHLNAGEENLNAPFMRKPSLIDCSKTYMVPRGLLEVGSLKRNKDPQVGTMSDGVMRQIAIGLSYMTGLSQHYDLKRIAEIERVRA